MTTGALHHHLANKDELMFGVLDHAAETIRHHFEEEDLSPDGALRVAGIVRHLWKSYPAISSPALALSLIHI